METAVLICNNKELNYDTTIKAYSIYEYLKKQGNQVQIVDYNLLDNKASKKSKELYEFLSQNTILTINRYSSFSQLEETPSLVDRYIIVDGDYNDLAISLNGNNNLAYGIKDITNSQIERIKDNYLGVSTSFKLKDEMATQVVNPIFLLSKEEWYDIIHEKSEIDTSLDYILIYSDTVTKEMLKYAYTLSQKNESKIFILANKVEGIFSKGKRLKNVSPIDLVNLISEAQDVITSCDEGIEFSVLFDRNLHIFTTKENEQLELINELKLESRVVDNAEQCLGSSRNYEYAKASIDNLKNISYNFINSTSF